LVELILMVKHIHLLLLIRLTRVLEAKSRL
jgi:hypothetical protein